MTRIIRLWDTTIWTEVATLTGHADWVRMVTFSPDGQLLASGSDDNTIKIWDTHNFQEIASFDQPNPVSSVAFLHRTGHLLATNGEVLEGGIKIWDVNAKQPVTTLIGSSLPDQQSRLLAKHLVAFSPDGQAAR